MTPYQPGEHPILVAVSWIQAVLIGPVATSLAVIAVASIGLMMLSGRVNIRRGATVIIGCFVVFGAAAIAQGFQSAARALPEPREAAFAPEVEQAQPLESPIREPAPPYDPYAGAAVRR